MQQPFEAPLARKARHLRHYNLSDVAGRGVSVIGCVHSTGLYRLCLAGQERISTTSACELGDQESQHNRHLERLSTI